MWRTGISGASGASGESGDSMECPHCKVEMRQTGKDTFSGQVIREYKCDQCGYESWEDDGKALWQVLHDDNEEKDKS